MKKIEKCCELLMRVMTLNETNKDGFYYSLDFNGNVNSITFSKRDANHNSIVMVYAYLDADDLGHPLSAVEKAIEIEENEYGN